MCRYVDRVRFLWPVASGFFLGALLGLISSAIAYGSCFADPYDPDTSLGCRVEEYPLVTATLCGVVCALAFPSFVGVARRVRARR